MKLSERITQLAKYQIDFDAVPLDEHNKCFEGDIVARFEDGESVEYISSGRSNKMFEYDLNGPKGDLVMDEGGRTLVEASHHIMQDNYALPGEEHKILDLKAGMMYAFVLPKRSIPDKE